MKICETLLYYYQDINQKETVKKIIGYWPYCCVITGFVLLKKIQEKLVECYILIYLSYKKSLNICKTLQYYSQDINYYETVKKVHKKVIKNFDHLTTLTLPLYGNQMNRTSLTQLVEH